MVNIKVVALGLPETALVPDKLQYARGEEFFGYGYQPLKTVANQPRLMFQFRTAMRVGKSELVTSFNRQSASASSAADSATYAIVLPSSTSTSSP